MPFSFTLNLLAPAAEAPLPCGQQVRGLVYELLRLGDAALAERVHELQPHKPFTVSPIRKPRQAEGQPPARQRHFRVATLTTEVAVALLQAVAAVQQDGAEVTLGGDRYALDLRRGAVRPERELAYQALLQAPPLHSVELRVLSPAAFRDGPHNVPLPLPGPLLRSLLAKWNAFSESVAIPPGVAEQLPTAVVLPDHDIKVRRLRLADRTEVGFVGRVRLSLHQRQPELEQAFATLVHYSEFAGIGARCTMGMGQVRVAETVEG